MKKRIFYATGIILGLFVLLLIFVPSTPEQSKVSQPVVSSNQATTTVSASTTSPLAKEAVVPRSPQITTVSLTQQPAVLSQPSGLVKVVSVMDGDTVKVSLSGKIQTVRLIGIDTPETVDPRKPVQCFGREASDKTKATLAGQMVRLESDSTQGNLDKYQRLLRYVFLVDGTSFDEMMVAQGYAHEYTYNLPYKYQAEFRTAQAAAEKAQLGFWNPSTCNGNTTTAAASSSPATAQIQPTPASQSSGHIFYLSTYYTSRYYYCDTDPGWQSLSKKYLKSYPSAQALLAQYPSMTLHAACQ